MATKKILVLFGHPAIAKSRVNRKLAETAANTPDVKVVDLYERYPDFVIDVAEEQKLLREHDIIVFQHPFYWYSVPAIFKEWFDLVLEYGFAYGPGGTALTGKRWLSAITTGGLASSYCVDGHNHFTISQLLAPIEQTARLCGMRFLEPHVVHGAHQVEEKGELHQVLAAYRARLESLRDGK